MDDLLETVEQLSAESERRGRIIRALLCKDDEDNEYFNAYIEGVDVRSELEPELQVELDTVFQEGQLSTLGEGS